ncbi:putative chemotaxis protein-glutamate methylesterase [Geobacter sp. OR-1]|uniref:chemotaxis protein CheB n=1 Tax=Geobacter sp. OR-1 TaxID=1266765 RepID=UPI000542F3A5|nr:chemotaxis protein CheB [Geobacter sp. OR-1]GAM09061.1 putative chemotaxis protein-glutamate methylesterase [Geobacter sp. OR-1]
MDRKGNGRFRAVVIGVSTGGVEALKILLGGLQASYPLPILIVAHIASEASNGLALLLDDFCSVRVKEADELEEIVPGTAYIAPPNYHMQLERDGKITLSVDPPVNFARPSADVLFETAADAMGAGLIAVVLTGAGSDGSIGLKAVAAKGGTTVVQCPMNAVADSMPKSAAAVIKPDYVMPLERIPELLIQLAWE